MARGKPWTPQEDQLILEEAEIFRASRYMWELRPKLRPKLIKILAMELGRTEAAVKMRASRLGIHRYHHSDDLQFK